MSRTKDFNWDKIMNHELEDEDLDWLPDEDDSLTETETLSLHIQTLCSEISSVCDDLLVKRDRLNYYAERFTLEDLDALRDRLKKLTRDFGL